MRKTVLFIAMSLDGYIADKDGGVGWLLGQDAGAENGNAYSEFVKGIDTVIMGWDTYHQVATELSPTEWVYREFTSYVVTHREGKPAENIHFTHESPCSLVKRLKGQEGKGIWVCGGAKVVQQLMAEGLVDRFHISIIPTILGGGIRLFGPMDAEVPLRLIRAESCNGITELVYEKRLPCLAN